MLDPVTAKACEICGKEFTAKRADAKYCCDSCRYKAKNIRLHSIPEQRERERMRVARWYQANKHTVRERVGERRKTARALAKQLGIQPSPPLPYSEGRPYLHAAPEPDGYIPGGAFTLACTPALRWPIALRNVRGLHGAVTDIMSREGVHHHPNLPEFTLLPWPSGVGWAVYIRDQDCAATLAGGRHRVRIFDQDVELVCGPLARLRWPGACPRKRNLVQLDAVTPIIIRRSGRDDGAHGQQPTSGALYSTLASWMPERVGVSIDPKHVRIQILKSSGVEKVNVPMLGKFGVASGWVGSFVVECNAPGLWLLRLAAQIGLGGKTAFGFGRVRVTDAG